MRRVRHLSWSVRLAPAVFVCSVPFLTGCGNPSQSTPSGGTTAASSDDHDHSHGHDHAHDHAALGPHGGHIMELGDEQYHAEWTHNDKAKSISVYFLDGAMEHAAAAEPDSVKIVVAIRGQEPKSYSLAALAAHSEAHGESHAADHGTDHASGDADSHGDPAGGAETDTPSDKAGAVAGDVVASADVHHAEGHHEGTQSDAEHADSHGHDHDAAPAPNTAFTSSDGGLFTALHMVGAGVEATLHVTIAGEPFEAKFEKHEEHDHGHGHSH